MAERLTAIRVKPFWWVINDEGVRIAEVNEGVDHRNGRRAKRFAAVDDMYEALEAMLKAFDSGERERMYHDEEEAAACQVARAALAKAKGEV